MKKIVTLFVILTSTLLYSQNSGITYQAVLYNPSGEILPGNNNSNSVLSEKDICLRFSITDASSTTEYQETQKVRTDLFGMVNLVVGTGNQVGGYAANFDAILWNSSNKNLKVEIDITGTCSAFIVVSDQKFSAVPFAYASKVAENVSGIVAIANGGTGSNSVSGAKTNLGLNNIDNTSDLNKPISLAAQTALNTKENAANKSTNASLGTSDVLFPTQNAVKTYVDNQISTGVVDADTTIKGKIKIAGDIAGTADMPVIATNAVNATKIANGAVTDAKIASVSSSKIIGAIPVTQINGAVSKVNGVLPYGDGSVVIPFGMVRTGTLALRPAVGTTTNGDIYVVSGDSNTNNNGLTYISDGATWNEVTPNQASLDARYLKLGGGTMSGNIVVPSGKFISVADAPTLATDVPNKAYVDSMITGGATADATTTSLGKIKLAGDLTGTADAPTITNSAVIGKVLTGYSAAAGTVVASDNILQAIQKVDGNVALKENTIASGTTSEYFRGDKTWQTLDKAAVSLTNVDNTSDANKPVSTATQTALDVKVDKVSGKGLSTEDYTTAEKTKLDGIEAEAEKNVNADWNATTGDAQILNKPTIPSIAGLATETFVNDGLALKANLASPAFTGTVSGITKAMVGLANADNISDANKPVSTATQTALDLKANLASPTFTGDATAATAGVGDNDTSIATTAFVSTAITNAATPNASTTTLGKIQLGGDLAGPSSSASVPVITNGAITTLKLADASVTNAKIGEIITVANGGTGATSLTGYVKGNGTAAFTSVSTIPVAHVDGAVRKVNGVEPDATGNVATMLGRVFTGNNVDPDLSPSIINASPTKQQSDIYIVAESGNANNGRTFIYDGTIWLEVATNLSTTDARYVNADGDTMEGNLTVPTGTKIILADAPTGSTDAANKAYVDTKIGGSGTTNFVPKFSATKTLTNSSIFDDGTKVGIGTASPANTLEIKQGNAGNSGLRFTNLNSSSAATTSASKVLGLNSTGDVILTNIPGTQNIVDFSTATPTTSGVVFTPNSPADESVIYQSTLDNSMWTYSGTSYVTYTPPASTAWFTSGTTNDAGNSKSSNIYRTGRIGIGTSAPQNNIDVVGGISVRSTAGAPGTGFGMEINTSGSAPRIDWVSNGAYIGQFSSTATDFWLRNSLNNTGNIRFMTSTAGIGAERFTILNNGNVGIGNSAPSTTLHVNNTLSATNSINASAQVLRLSRPSTSGVKWDNIAQFNLGAYSAATVAANSRLDLSLTDGGNNTTLTNVMTWQANGNVGINNTAPSAPLVIQGVTGTGALKLIAPSVTSGDNWWLGFGHGTTSTDANDRARIGAEIIAGGAGRLFFTTGLANAQTRAMFIDESQRIGVGTSAPTGQFEIATTNGLSSVIRRFGNSNQAAANLVLQKTYGTTATTHGLGITNGDYVGRILFSASNGSSYLTNGTDIVGYAAGTQSTTNNGGGIFFRTVPQNSVAQSVERMRIDENGNIGIGTSSPTALLEITSPSGNGVAPKLRLTNPIGKKWELQSGISTVNDAYFGILNATDNVQVLTAKHTGEVGIGTTAPTAQLHTTGTVRFAGAGTPAAGKVLTSDASGNATWQPGAIATTVSNKTTDFSLSSTDNGGVIVVNSANTVTLTVPSTLSAGFSCQIIQQGAGQVKVEGSGVSVTSALGTFSRTMGSSIGIMITSSTTAFLSGDTAF